EVLAERLRSNPADQDAYATLKRLYRSQGDFASLINLIAGWAGWVADPHASSTAYAEVGDLLAQELGDAERAESFYQEALRRSPMNGRASDALLALWEAQGNQARMAEHLQEQ